MPETHPAPNPPQTAPTDGRFIRGYFVTPGEAHFVAVAWDGATENWVDLLGKQLPSRLRLAAWGED